MNLINLNQNKVIVSMGYDNTTTNITLASGHGTILPDVSIPYNLIWWNASDYLSPTDDPSAEIVKCIAKIGDTLIIMRSQQQTLASPKNIPGKLYNMALLPDTLHDSNLDTNLNTLSYYNIPQTHGISTHTGTIGDHSTNLSNVGTNTHAQIDTAITASIGHIAASGTSVHSLGTMSTQAANNVSITGGSITGMTSIGIGTVSPIARLEIIGYGIGLPPTSGTTVSAGEVIRIRPGDNAVLDIGGNSAAGAWLQSTDQTGLQSGYPLLLNPNGGNVGIGTTNPGSKLVVTGGDIQVTTTQSRLIFDNSLRYIQGTRVGADYLTIAQNAYATGIQFGFDAGPGFGPTMTILPVPSTNNPGNVGIGTTTPGKIFDVVSNIGNPQYCGGGIEVDGLYTTKLHVTSQSGYESYISKNASTGIMTIHNGHSGGYINIEGGNVGIGTTSPTQKLHVVGNLEINAGLGGAMRVYSTNSRATEMFISALDSLSNLNLYGAIIRYSTNGWDAIDGGLVGDNTSALEILSRKGGANTSTFTKISSEDGPIVFATGGVDPTPSRMLISSTGNVGIGTTNPGLKLQVDGITGLPATTGSTQTGVFRVGVPTYGSVIDMGTEGTSGRSWIQVTNESNLAENFALLLNPNGGNVGIGIADPTAKLHVGGTSGIDGIKFPDGTLQTTAAVGQPITTYYASNAIRVAHDVENLTISGTYVVNKTITLKQRFVGSMTIVYNHRTVNSAGTNMSKVLVNGSLVGSEHTQSDNTNNVYSVTVSNVDYAVNTTIQVWAKSTGTYPWTYISNFRLLYADAVNS